MYDSTHWRRGGKTLTGGNIKPESDHWARGTIFPEAKGGSKGQPKKTVAHGGKGWNAKNEDAIGLAYKG